MRTFLAAALMLAASSAAAQNVRLADRTALMFNLGGIFSSTPTALDGVGVGGRYFLNESMAVRAGLGLSLASEKSETSQSGFSQDSNDSSNTIAIEGAVEFVLMRAKAAYLYTGGLLQLGYNSTDPDGGNNNTDGFSTTLAGLLGANYFLMEGLSVGAEYRLGLNYTSAHQDRGPDADADQTSTVLGVGTVGFHLGFWF